MNSKSATALFAASVLIGSEIALHRSDLLVPTEHVHAETRSEPVATTATYIAASGKQSAFDNEAFSPARPWERWWQADDRMTAAQGMMRLDV